MAQNKNIDILLREIPSVDQIKKEFDNLISEIPYIYCIDIIRKDLNLIRQKIRNGILIDNIAEYTFNEIKSSIKNASKSSLKTIINGTGIILHTGLGRAPISDVVIKRAIENITPYTNLELDLSSGKRGERNEHVKSLINSLTGSESSLIVNNNAAAVLLMLNTFSEGKEVIISRGEQVEIGGSFRIPDVIIKSGCKMVEVGTTNKTHLKDYESAINKNTGAILVAHTSNFKVLGFTHSVDLSDLNLLAKKKKIPLIVDLGCGAIAEFKKIGLPNEPSVLSYVKSATGVFSFSGDKLLGGPQSGIICGKRNMISKIHHNALYRALRADKYTYSILNEILRTHLNCDEVHLDNLAINLLQRSRNQLKKIANKILKKLDNRIIKKYDIKIVETEVVAGSGSLPLEKINSIAIVIKGDIKISNLSKKFRLSNIPLLGYIKSNAFYIDFKAIPPVHEKVLVDVLRKILV